MPATDFNKPEFRSQVWKGFVQFQVPDGSVWYRLKEKQNMQTTFSFERATHYTDTGRKFLDPSGYNHRFAITLKLTADMIESVTNSAPSNKTTLSYWIYKNAINDPVELIFVNTFEANSQPDTSGKFIHFKFRLDPSVFGPITTNDGSSEIVISGEIVEITTATRTTSSDAPADPTTVWRPS